MVTTFIQIINKFNLSDESLTIICVRLFVVIYLKSYSLHFSSNQSPSIAIDDLNYSIIWSACSMIPPDIKHITPVRENILVEHDKLSL